MGAETMDKNESGTISRRTVAKGAAWAVPAAVALGAAPASASSKPCLPTFSFGGSSCKCPGQSDGSRPWNYYLQICNTLDPGCTPTGGNAPTTIYIWSVASNSGVTLGGLSPVPYPIPANSCDTSYVQLQSSNSAAKLHFVFSYTPDGPKYTSVDIFAPPDCPTDASKACLPPTGGSIPSAAKTTSSAPSSSTSAPSTSAPSSSTAPSTSTTAPTSQAPSPAAPSSTAAAPDPTAAG